MGRIHQRYPNRQKVWDGSQPGIVETSKYGGAVGRIAGRHFTSNFFEHLPSKDNLSATIKEANRCLKNAGLLICMGPNIKYIGGAHWDFWDHCLPLTDVSMESFCD